MSDRMTCIELPGSTEPGFAEWGRVPAEGIIARYRAQASNQRTHADAVLAAADEDFRITTYLGPHAQRKTEVIQPGRDYAPAVHTSASMHPGLMGDSRAVVGGPVITDGVSPSADTDEREALAREFHDDLGKLINDEYPLDGTDPDTVFALREAAMRGASLYTVAATLRAQESTVEQAAAELVLLGNAGPKASDFAPRSRAVVLDAMSRISDHDAASINAVTRALSDVLGYVPFTERHAIAVLAIEGLTQAAPVVSCETCGQPATYRLGMPTPAWCDAHGPAPVVSSELAEAERTAGEQITQVFMLNERLRRIRDWSYAVAPSASVDEMEALKRILNESDPALPGGVPGPALPPAPVVSSAHEVNPDEREALAKLLAEVQEQAEVGEDETLGKWAYRSRLMVIFREILPKYEAGFRRPVPVETGAVETVTTVEDLEALPVGSVVRRADFPATVKTYVRYGGGWVVTAYNGFAGPVPLPARVLFRPDREEKN